MSDVSDLVAGFDLWPYLEAVQEAFASAPTTAGSDQIPPVADSRDLLRLFVQIGNDDLRRALIDLVRAMVESN